MMTRIRLRFRPLTGILFFNSNWWLIFGVICIAFPSPYGDFVFQLPHKAERL